MDKLTVNRIDRALEIALVDRKDDVQLARPLIDHADVDARARDRRKIAGEMLHFVCEDMKGRGVPVLYLVTDHTSFYERYGWRFLCMAQGDGESEPTRLYIHEA